MILLIGANGSMGRRYRAVLSSLGEPVLGVDKEFSPEAALTYVRHGQPNGVIIASPTDTHEAYLRALALSNVPILCEKPITKDLDALRELLRMPAPLRMMSQYALLDSTGDGSTEYDFYHHGNDGAAWDCMQVLGLARGDVAIHESSPVWRCVLNGRSLTLDEVGRAYVEYVKLWLAVPEGDRAQMWTMHERARYYGTQVYA